MRLTGVIDYSMGNFLCIRGFCSMIQLANISETIPEIQRDLLTEHAGEMERFLSGGEFTFFPEVILCSDLKANGASEMAVEALRMAVRQNKNLNLHKVGQFKFSIKGYDRKSEQDQRLNDSIQSVYMDFEPKNISKFLRIDGNHRLSAVNEASSYKEIAIPFCLLLFNGADESNKFCRALFHNINTKQIPLRDEENLNVIIRGEDVFSDEDLLSNFGSAYLYTRQICEKINLDHFPLISKYIGRSRYTYFVGIFEHLLKEHLIEDSEESVDVIIQKLSDINTALRESGIANVTENISVLGAMTFYKLQNEVKYKSFIQWVQKNNIGIADKLHINDVISIYDSIYANTPKRVFLARWYPDREPELSKANGRLAVIKRIVEEDFGLQLIDLGTKGGGTYFIRDLMYREIEASDIFIADLTSNRHNVMVEVGYAIKNVGLDRMLLYLEPMEGAEDPPFDLNGFRYELIADSNDIELKVKPKLKEILDGMAIGEL